MVGVGGYGHPECEKNGREEKAVCGCGEKPANGRGCIAGVTIVPVLNLLVTLTAAIGVAGAIVVD